MNYALGADAEIAFEALVCVDAENPVCAVAYRCIDECAVVSHFVPNRPVSRDAEKLEHTLASLQELCRAVSGTVVERNDPVDVRSDVGDETGEVVHLVSYRDEREQADASSVGRIWAARRDCGEPEQALEHDQILVA